MGGNWEYIEQDRTGCPFRSVSRRLKGDDMGHLSGTLEMNVAPEVVWKYLSDASLRPKWEVGVVAVEDVTGPLDTLGSTWTEVRKMGGMTMRQHFTVSRVDRMSLLEFTGALSGGGLTVIRESIAPRPDGGTTKSFVVDYALPGGLVGRILDRLYVQKKLERSGEEEDERVLALVGGSALA